MSTDQEGGEHALISRSLWSSKLMRMKFHVHHELYIETPALVVNVELYVHSDPITNQALRRMHQQII